MLDGIDPENSLPERSKFTSSLQSSMPLGNSPLSPMFTSTLPHTLFSVEFKHVTPTFTDGTFCEVVKGPMKSLRD